MNSVPPTRQWNCLPDVSAEWPWRSWNIFPQALATAAILAITGKLWITNDTSFFWCLAKFWACPSKPKPVTSVAPWALYLCINLAAENHVKMVVINLSTCQHPNSHKISILCMKTQLVFNNSMQMCTINTQHGALFGSTVQVSIKKYVFIMTFLWSSQIYK